MSLHHTKVGSKYSGEDSILKLLEDILDSINHGAIILNSDLHVVFANKHVHSMLSTTETDEVEEIFLRNCPSDLLKKSGDERCSVTYIDFALPGKREDLLAGVNIYRLGYSGKTFNYIVIIHDFSKWRKLDEVHCRFATSISHRLRTPLTAAKNAISILSENNKSISSKDSKKLLDIGWRNIEKLVALFEELQKVFMIDSEKVRINRSLFKVDEMIESELERLRMDGRIESYRFDGGGHSLMTVRSALKRFICDAVDIFSKWMDCTPSIECSTKIKSEDQGSRFSNESFIVSFKPVYNGSYFKLKGNLKDSLIYSEAHQRLLLNEVASSLDGKVEIDSEDLIILSIPLTPPFDLEMDRINPLQTMIERNKLLAGSLHLISVRIIGMIDDPDYYKRMFQEELVDVLSDRCLVTSGEEPLSWSIIIIGEDSKKVEEKLSAMRTSFETKCRENGRKVFPGISWEIKYRCNPGDSDGAKPDFSGIMHICD